MPMSKYFDTSPSKATGIQEISIIYHNHRCTNQH